MNQHLVITSRDSVYKGCFLPLRNIYRHDISLGLIADAEKINFSTGEWDPGIPEVQ